MRFTTLDIRHNRKLSNFIRTRVKPPEETKVINNYLYNVYETKEVIEIIDNMIKDYKHRPQYSRFIPDWKKHREFLKKFGS